MTAYEKEAEMFEEWEDEQEGFHVVDDAGAAWCVKKIREAQEERDRMIAWYDAQIERAKKRCAAVEERMRAYLMEYADSVPMKETKTQKSYPIPGGKMVWKKAHIEWKHDDAQVLDGLKKTGRTEFIKTVEKLDWASLKKELVENGEVIDGVTVEEVPEEFVVRIDSEG